MTEREAGVGMKKAERRATAAPPGRQASWRALGLAVAAHSLLFAVLFFGIAWKTTDDCKNGIPAKPGYFEAMWDSVRVVFGYPPAPRKECAIQIEMWSPGTGSGGTRTPSSEPKIEPKPDPTPEPAREPPPKPTPAPIPIPVKPVVTPPPPPPPKPAPVKPPPPQAPTEIKPPAKPDLALERERAAREKAAREKVDREKADREKAEQEKAAREKVEREKVERDKAERAKADKEKADRDRAQKEKLEREKAEREKAERERIERDRLEREKADRENLERERLEREKADRSERERVERERVERAKAEREAAEQRRKSDFARDIARSQAEAGEGSRSSSGGSSAGASGGGGSSNRNAEWAGRVKSAIRENTTFAAPPDMVGNPQVVFRVALSPDCALVRVDRINSSGVPSWDQAAERAVRKTNPFPRFPGGQCPASFELTSRPND